MNEHVPSPGRGLPIVPQAMRELCASLGVEAELSVAGTDVRVGLGDLDESAWDRFGEASCKQLAREFRTWLRRRFSSLPSELRQQRLPPLPPGASLSDLPLGRHVRHVLERNGLLEAPNGLRRLSLVELLRLPGFGISAVLDLWTSLEALANGKLGSWPVPGAPDPRNPPTPEKLVDEAPEVKSLEEELQEIVRCRGSERSAQLVLRRLGWDGRGGCTLAAAGREAGISRQRVDQLVKRIQAALRDRGMQTPFLDR
ncbi:MAG: hypothetical protein ACE5F1_20540, partial [Planctomycetota bacterium]